MEPATVTAALAVYGQDAGQIEQSEEVVISQFTEMLSAKVYWKLSFCLNDTIQTLTQSKSMPFEDTTNPLNEIHQTRSRHHYYVEIQSQRYNS